jgi:hypothetical protein
VYFTTSLAPTVLLLRCQEKGGVIYLCVNDIEFAFVSSILPVDLELFRKCLFLPFVDQISF